MVAVMGIEDAFLHDILAHPDDDAPRLIYADWLDEHNNPRGEFIRVQCALAELNEEDPRRWPLELREQELLRKHEAKWLPRGIEQVQPVFRRGFVEEIALTPEAFPTQADRIFEQAPIRKLHLYRRGLGREEHPDDSLSRVAASRHLTHIRSLRLTEPTLSQRDWRDFLTSPSLRQLVELQVTGFTTQTAAYHQYGLNSLSLQMVHDLTELSCRDNLTTLHLEHGTLTLDALRILASTSSLPRLRELSLTGNRLTHEAARVLAHGPLLTRLETLQLDSNRLGDAGALIVSEWPTRSRLICLKLGHNQIFTAGVKALAKAPALCALISLDLFGNISCDDGAVDLAASRWVRLQALNLRFNGVGDRGVRALARSEAFSSLARLDLTANRITSAGARVLIESPYLSNLARLELLRNDIAATEQQKLRERFGPFVYC